MCPCRTKVFSIPGLPSGWRRTPFRWTTSHPSSSHWLAVRSSYPSLVRSPRCTTRSSAGFPCASTSTLTNQPALIVYFHGGGWCLGSVALMDAVARELAFATAAAVVSVEYRMAPEHPYPAALDDSEAVTRWALANAPSLGASERTVMVAGESAGGNLAAAVSLRLRDDRAMPGLAGQILIYPVLDAHGSAHASRKEFSGLIVSEVASEFFWTSYAGERDIERDPFAAPLHATTLTDLPPALVVLGGCDVLRDEGRAYAQRLEEAGVDTTEVCYPGQPHGFVNFGFPAAADAFEMIGRMGERAQLVADVVSPTDSAKSPHQLQQLCPEGVVVEVGDHRVHHRAADCRHEHCGLEMAVGACRGTDQDVGDALHDFSIGGMIGEEAQHDRIAEYHAHRPAAVDGQIDDAGEQHLTSAGGR